jgi:hypothetical protein
MTAQINDRFRYFGEPFELVGIKGQGLFDPAEHGIRCTMMHTACWRGFIAGYAVEEGELRLVELEMQLDELGPGSEPPKVYRVAPRGVSEHGRADYTLQARVPFSGGLLLAQDFVQELYVHMGFHPAWKYRRVHELSFEDGKLVREADRSKAMAGIRARIAARPLGPGGTDEDELKKWIEQCFDRSYV